MHLPALIEFDGCIHFSLIGKAGVNLICPVSVPDRKVRQIGTPPPPLPAEGYVLVAVGKLAEDTLRASGQWEAVLTFMASQLDAAVASQCKRYRMDTPQGRAAARKRAWAKIERSLGK